MKPKDPTPDNRKCGVIYELKCAECDSSYVGETARALETRLKEHRHAKGTITAVGEHLHSTGRKLSDEGKRVIGRQEQFWLRKILESIEIRQRTPNLNRDTGYQLPPIYNNLLSCDREALNNTPLKKTTRCSRKLWSSLHFDSKRYLSISNDFY